MICRTSVFAFLFCVLFTSPIALALPPQSAAIQVGSSRLSFRYLSFDGETNSPCKHEVLSAESGDWKVTCADGPLKRDYTVHLWVNRYLHTTAPKVSYETLYWIVDTTRPDAPRGHSSTVWFHLKEPSALSLLEFRQGVDADTAYLELTLRLPEE